MYNVLKLAIPHIKKVCPLVTIEVSIHPQAFQTHGQSIDTPAPPVPFTIEGLVQTQAGDNKITSYTINSPRFFKVYLTSDITHLSSLQTTQGEVILRFHYNGRQVTARVYTTQDYIYNGWVRLDCSEVPSHYNAQTPRSYLK